MRMSMRRIFRRGFSQISTETNGLVQETSTFRSNRATVIFLGVPVVLTTMLGIWQVKRLQNKRVKIAMRLQRLQGTPLEGLPDDLDEKRDEYKRIRIRGTFDQEKGILFGPRSMPKGVPPRLSPSAGGVGYYCVAPLHQDDGTVILVNRGWYPQVPKDSQHPDPIPEGPVVVEGILRFSDDANRWTPKNDADGGNWFWIDVPSALHALGETGPPVFVETLCPPSQKTLPWPKGYEDHVNFYVDPVTHVVYAITWFSLALFMASMIYSKLYGRWGRGIRRAGKVIEGAGR